MVLCSVIVSLFGMFISTQIKTINRSLDELKKGIDEEKAERKDYWCKLKDDISDLYENCNKLQAMAIMNSEGIKKREEICKINHPR